MGGDVTQPSGTEGADLVAPHWPEWSETSYVDGSRVALARAEAAGRGADAGISGAMAVPESGGCGVAADALVTQYNSLGADLTVRAAHHTAEAKGLALNGANHYSTKTILAGIAEDHDDSRDALIAAGMTAGIPQSKMQEVLDELKRATSTAAQDVGQANQEAHRALTAAINTGTPMSAPPKAMPGGAGLPADVPSQLAPLLQMGTQGPQMASGAVGQLISGLSGMTGTFVDPLSQLVSSVGQGGQPFVGGVEGGGLGGGEHGGSQWASHHEGKGDEGKDGFERKDFDQNSQRDGEPKTLESSGHEKNGLTTTHLASSGSTVQLDTAGGATTHVSSGAVGEAPVAAAAQAPVPASGMVQQQPMGGQLAGVMGGSPGITGAPAHSPSTPRSSARAGSGRHDGDQASPGDAAAGAAATVVGMGVGGVSGLSDETIFGARILAHMVHQDPTLTAAAVAVYPMGSGIYAITCTPDALGALRGGIVAPHATMPLASLTSIPGEFRAAWSGIADPVAALCAAVKGNYLARPEVIVALRAPGVSAEVMADTAVVQVSMEQLLATDPVDDATTMVEKVVAPAHIAPIIDEMATEWSVPADMDLATAYGFMRSRNWYGTRDPEYVFAMAWWMVIEARTALAGGDPDHAATLAWQLLALPPAPALTDASV